MAARVSVIVTCFDLGRFLEEALTSVEEQTYPAHEIVVVDDGSTDPHTLAVLSALDRPKTRVLRTEHRGPGAARNHGIRASRGDHVCSLDADDLLLPTWLEKAVQALDQDPGLAFVSCWTEAFGDEHWVAQPPVCDLPQLLESNPLHCSTLVRREVLEAVGGFDEALGACFEDWDLWLRIAQRWRGTILPEVLFRYRRRADSTSRQLPRGEVRTDPLARILQKHEQLYREWLPSLVLRQEDQRASLQRQALDDQEASETWLSAQLAWSRARLAALQREAALSAELRSLSATRHRLHEDLERVTREKAEALQERDALREALELTARENHALRESVSWRLTGPLRRAYDVIRLRPGKP